MENSSRRHKELLDLDSPCDKSRGKQPFCEIVDDLVNHFESNLDELLNTEEQDASMVYDDSSADEEYDDLSPYRSEVGQKVLSKSATFPSNGKILSSISSSNEEDDDPETALQQLFSEEPIQRSISLPLVSAMKGSREKQGLPLKKLAVNWAPNVYDPPPTSLSHCISRGTKQQKCRKGKINDEYNKKKNGKKGQKGNLSRGKEKKQKLRKVARNDKSYRSLDACPDDSDGLVIGSPDYCGSSFLKKSVSNMHYSVAEAL
ncbi:hypothetical protein HS088_TW05G00259 [Tripterygium wilfordii]|uniref:Uncharacterized protein n=1 Tax=Tripterygium wilfordii TaxID=458696 RepID=A0A7J7DN72_TRIWF|nr:uncharacterized protein LOC119998937 [Tripterygium wilfordii]KAF5747536.1 hypothetical protein HS088_TW05G00259 [Tripterygium wilfordii]